MRYAFLGEQRLARLDPVDVGVRTAPVTKTGSGLSLASNGNGSTPNSIRAVALGLMRAWCSPVGCIALAALVFACLLLIPNKRARKAPAYALRFGTVAISVSLVTLGSLGIQACASDHGSRIPSLREQSVEIETVPDGAEFYLADAQQSPLAVVSKAASVVSRVALHPFGHVRFQVGRSGDPWGFVGNEEDRGSGISDFHARPYRAELGVFLAVDPVALLTPEQTIGSAARLLPYAYAASDPITQSDPNGLTFGDFARGMWDQGVETAKNAAKGAYAAAKSTAARALRGDVAGAGKRVVKGVADGLDRTIDNVVHFGDDFVNAATAGSDYESGRLAVKPVTTAMGASALILGPRVGAGKSVNAPAPPTKTRVTALPAAGDRVYRVWGGEAESTGRSWTRTDPRTVPNYRDAAGLPAQNAGRFVSEGKLVDTKGVQSRQALELHGNGGGLDELVVPHPNAQIRLTRVSGVNPEF